MPKSMFPRVLLLLLLALLASVQATFAADLPLPASPWYAVTWEEATDTLHWINASGEQASIARPKLEGQISQTQTRLHISPNGRYLIVISPLLNGREGIGFYNFQTGQFVQIHESQPNEIFLPAGRQPFTETSSHFAIPLRNQISGDWRMIVFETATGNVVDVLARTDANMPQGFNTDTNWWPQVANFNLDEALNTLEVRFQFVTEMIQMPPLLQAYNWRIPPVQNTDTVMPYVFQWSPLVGFDIHPMTGEILFGLWDAQNGPAPSTSAANRIHYQPSADAAVENIAAELGGSATLPRWLHNGDWIAYYRNNGALALHWLVMTRDGQTSLPVSPGIISVHHTPDGFLSKSTSAWRLDHTTTLALEGFAEPVGTTIYQPGTAFAVVFTSPANTPFELPSVAEPFVQPAGPDNLQAVPTNAVDCPPFAPPPRLTVGQQARVTFTDGSNLNVRVAPGGNLLTQIAEGTVVDVIADAVCADGYLFWNIRLANATTGWAAEGANGVYFLEPFGGDGPSGPGDIQAQPTVAPTIPPLQGPGIIIIPTTPEPTAPPLVRVPVATATPTPNLGIIVAVPICNGSPETRLMNTSTARTVQPDGTLALRTALSDPIPSHQVPAGLNVNLVGGPECRDNLRMWQIQVSLNGQQVTGWVAEGSGSTYYLAPPLGISAG